MCIRDSVCGLSSSIKGGGDQVINAQGRQEFAVDCGLVATEFSQVGIPLALHSANSIPLGLPVTNKVKLFQLGFSPYLHQLEIRVLEMYICYRSTAIRESLLSIVEHQ